MIEIVHNTPELCQNWLCIVKRCEKKSRPDYTVRPQVWSLEVMYLLSLQR